ncbi:MAG: aminopeptidase YwaD [Marinoscillum sp.]|jgi:aminopeptidase YwaD
MFVYIMKKTLILIALIGSTTFGFAQKDKKLTDKTVDKNSIAAHLKFISSDALGGRDTPSTGLEVAAEYLRTQLELYGVKPLPEYPDYFQPVFMKKVSKANEGQVSVGKSTFSLGEDLLLYKGSDMAYTGEFVFLEYGMPSEIAQSDVKGKVIVCNVGDGEEQSARAQLRLNGVKIEAAKAAGAVSLIELYASPQIPWPLLVRYLTRDQVSLDDGEELNTFTSLLVNNANRQASEAFSNSDSLSVNISGSNVESFIVNNVVGYVEGTDTNLKETYVTYSAHYDHVGIGKPDSTGDNIYNGTRDNGIGTVTVLEAAKNLAMYPTKRSSLFVLFAGEEKGLLGSEWFVDHSPLPLKSIVFCFNSDNGGYNDTSMATVIGRDRTTAKELIVKAIETYGLTAGNDDKYKEQGLFDRSDNVSFASKGIPAPSFGMGVNEFDEQIFRTYHQPSDEFETVDMDYLYTFYRAYVLAGRFIGNMTETPFWVEGDKYYEIGKELYGR